MPRTFFVVCLVTSALLGGTQRTQAHVGVGVRVPPLIPPALLLSYTVSQASRLELDIAYQGAGSSTTLGLGASGKILAERIGSLSVAPFLGVGARVALVSLRIQGQTVSVMIFGVDVAFGLEAPIPTLARYAIFGELKYSLALMPTLSLTIGVAFGMRWDL